MFSKERPLLLSPGPVILPAEVKKALAKDMLHHRSPNFKQILKQCCEELKYFFQTQQEVLILSSTGTGAMEAAFTNSLSPGEEVICIGGGKFGQRWQAMAQGLSLNSHFLDTPWGQGVSLDSLRAFLTKYPKTKALVVCACETSTATDHPILEISKILKDFCPDSLLIVDAITGLGARPLNMDEWGIDIMVAGSQKTFWLSAGLSFISLSKRAWKRSLTAKLPKYYFDLNRERQAQNKGQTAFSSPVSLIQALKVSLDLLRQKGLPQLIVACENFKKSVHLFCKALDLKLYSSSPANALTAIVMENADDLKQKLEHSQHIVLAGGQGSLKNKILRIGHLGPLSQEDFLKALSALAQEVQQIYPEKDSKKALSQARFAFNPDSGIPSLEKKL